MTPETRYAKTGDLHIAYQVVGSGPVDIVFVPEFWHTIEVQWDQPELAAFLERLSSFGRLISFDQRGSGLSDPVSLDELPSIEQWMDDVRVVMDDAGSKSAVLMAIGGGGTMSMLFAATHPDRASGLVLVNSFARLSRAPDYPGGRGPEIEDEVRNVMRAGWGRGVFLDLVAPSRVGDEAFRQWWARYQRLGSSPGTIMAIRPTLAQIDVREVLPSISAPTLILHRVDNAWVRPEHSRYLAEHISGARYVELPGSDYFVFLGDSETVLGEIESFVAGVAGPPESDRLWRRFSSRSSSARPQSLPMSATGAGARCSTRSGSSFGESSRGTRGARSTRPGTVFWRRSTGRPARCAVRASCATQSGSSASRSGPGCTRARSSCSTAGWRGSPCTSASASSQRLRRARCSSRARSRTSPSGRGSSSRIADCTR